MVPASPTRVSHQIPSQTLVRQCFFAEKKGSVLPLPHSALDEFTAENNRKHVLVRWRWQFRPTIELLRIGDFADRREHDLRNSGITKNSNIIIIIIIVLVVSPSLAKGSAQRTTTSNNLRPRGEAIPRHGIHGGESSPGISCSERTGGRAQCGSIDMR